MSNWLVVRSADRTLALPVAQVEELLVIPPSLPAPGVIAAVRGVAPFRGRLVPLVHLASAIGNGRPPEDAGTTGVAVMVRGRRVLLEVDDAAELMAASEEALPHGWRGRWASGAIRQAGALVPVLDLDWLAQRLTAGEESATA